mmetsp:Transcript_2992/g.7109  ORF Transcript_2992/g.7109 Transcript_2992/m.7109 type:complete len:129 (-) Transcript_2992:25-411(-)
MTSCQEVAFSLPARSAVVVAAWAAGGRLVEEAAASAVVALAAVALAEAVAPVGAQAAVGTLLRTGGHLQTGTGPLSRWPAEAGPRLSRAGAVVECLDWPITVPLIEYSRTVMSFTDTHSQGIIDQREE